MTKPQGTGANAKDILKRIDYLGSGSLLVAVSSITVFLCIYSLSFKLQVGSTLVFLSVRYNEGLPVCASYRIVEQTY